MLSEDAGIALILKSINVDMAVHARNNCDSHRHVCEADQLVRHSWSGGKVQEA